jgi:hypothetical protein
MPGAFADHYRCPEKLGIVGVAGQLSTEQGYFTFRDVLCYGRIATAMSWASGTVPDVSSQVECTGGQVALPFDLSEVVVNLQQERYPRGSTGPLQDLGMSNPIRRLYYLLRPALPVAVRRPLQKLSLTGWERITFPSWPVDVTVETLVERALTLALQSSGRSEIPFIWFWPDGAPSCAIMTHDVEDRAGLEFCEELMDLDDSYGIKAAFQIIPEGRYRVSTAFLDRLRDRGVEVNVHDLDHGGQLFESRETFLERATKINRYGREFGSRGFRAGVMYRRQEWFDALEFAYDMSVPNVAHLEPQQGGCCTVMPFFIGNILELPLTTIQDYSLFHILGEYSTALWRTQADLIRAKHGLISFLTHPDYLIERRARNVYRDLLRHLTALRDDGKVWIPLPGEVDRWWRSRSLMSLVMAGSGWSIKGPDSHRARVAYASLDGDRLVYRVDDQTRRAAALR